NGRTADVENENGHGGQVVVVDREEMLARHVQQANLRRSVWSGNTQQARAITRACLSSDCSANQVSCSVVAATSLCWSQRILPFRAAFSGRCVDLHLRRCLRRRNRRVGRK